MSATANVVVKPAESWWERMQFLNLPWELYKDDPYWIPPLRDNQRELAGYAQHPFHEIADVKTFIAVQDGGVVGRIAAIVNHAHNERHKEKRGFFGFFESINDQEVATELISTARNWLDEQGMEGIRGPVNPSLNYECGLLVEGFDSSPFFMMTYNPPYYEELLRGAGLSKEMDMYAYYGHMNMLEGLDKKMDFIIQEAKRRFEIKLRRMDASRFDEEVRTFLHIYNESMRGTWSFTPLTEAEIDHMANSMRHLIAPELTSFAEIDGRPVAAVFGLLDYNPRIKAIDGELYPFGFIRLLWNKRAIKSMRVLAANVLPEYQMWGVGLVVLNRLLPEAFDWDIQDSEFSWVLENNKLSRGSLERGGAKRTKTYRLFHDGEEMKY